MPLEHFFQQCQVCRTLRVGIKWPRSELNVGLGNRVKIGCKGSDIWHVKPDVVHSRLLNARACVDEENAIQAPLWTIR